MHRSECFCNLRYFRTSHRAVKHRSHAFLQRAMQTCVTGGSISAPFEASSGRHGPRPIVTTARPHNASSGERGRFLVRTEPHPPSQAGGASAWVFTSLGAAGTSLEWPSGSRGRWVRRLPCTVYQVSRAFGLPPRGLAVGFLSLLSGVAGHPRRRYALSAPSLQRW